ncbi:hypothetical protein PLESTF_001411400 [Pleodorina starrii]|nr:hypothetical protein PLESTF_001411400 [Pleodorina starrii]
MWVSGLLCSPAALKGLRHTTHFPPTWRPHLALALALPLAARRPALVQDTTGGYFGASVRGPDGSLVDRPKDELWAAKERIVEQQAREGKMPGAMMMQDRLSGENKQEMWGNVSPEEYDEGAVQASYVTPGLDAGVGGSSGGTQQGDQAATRAAESAGRQSGSGGGTAEGGGRD